MEILVQPAELFERYFVEIQNLKPQIEDLEYKLDARGQGVKSVEEIQSQLNSLQSKRYFFSVCIVFYYNFSKGNSLYNSDFC